MLARLVSVALAFALGVVAPRLAGREDPGPPATVRQLAADAPRDASPEEEEAWREAARGHHAPVEAYAPGRVDRVTRLAPQAGFPGGRIIDGAFVHDAPCEADRRDVRVLAFTAAGAPTATLALDNAEPRDARVLRADRDEALVVLQGRRWRGDPAVELLAWDLVRGEVELLGAWRGTGVGWSFETGGVIRVHGGRCDRRPPAGALAERVGLTLVMD